MSNNKEYDKVNCKGLYIKLNKKTDADIIEFLDSVGNKQGLIKELIRTSEDYKGYNVAQSIARQSVEEG